MTHAQGRLHVRELTRIVTEDGGEIAVATKADPSYRKAAPANAAEIALRWNAHPTMLEALEAVNFHDDHEDCRFCDTSEGGPHDPGATCSLIIAAIAAAHGEE